MKFLVIFALLAVFAHANIVKVCIWQDNDKCEGTPNPPCQSVTSGECTTSGTTSAKATCNGGSVTAESWDVENCQGAAASTQTIPSGQCFGAGGVFSTSFTCGASTLPISLGALVLVSIFVAFFNH